MRNYSFRTGYCCRWLLLWSFVAVFSVLRLARWTVESTHLFVVFHFRWYWQCKWSIVENDDAVLHYCHGIHVESLWDHIATATKVNSSHYIVFHVFAGVSLCARVSTQVTTRVCGAQCESRIAIQSRLSNSFSFGFICFPNPWTADCSYVFWCLFSVVAIIFGL